MVTREPCPTCGQSEATPRRTVPSSAGYRCPDCKRFKIREYDPWDWTASLGPENSSEVGTGAKDATGGKSETRRMARAEALEVAVRAERERCARLVEDVAHDWEDTTMLEGVVRRIRSGEP